MSINTNTTARNSAWAKAYHEQKRHEWADRIEDMNRSGMTKAAYARRHGYSAGTVYRWLHILANEPAGDLIVKRGLEASKSPVRTNEIEHNSEVDQLFTDLRKIVSCTVEKQGYTLIHKRTHMSIFVQKNVSPEQLCSILFYMKNF